MQRCVVSIPWRISRSSVDGKVARGVFKVLSYNAAVIFMTTMWLPTAHQAVKAVAVCRIHWMWPRLLTMLGTGLDETSRATFLFVGCIFQIPMLSRFGGLGIDRSKMHMFVV